MTGGIGKSKTWIPDTGKLGKKQGFYSCYDPSATWKDMAADEGSSNWAPRGKTWWEPDNNGCGITEDDLNSYMIFSLEVKSGLEVHRFTGGVETVTYGLFGMNVDNYTISALDVDFVHGAWATSKAVDFKNNFQILYLDDEQLMIGNYRDEAMSGEGRCILCWNFVSKDYADNYEANK